MTCGCTTPPTSASTRAAMCQTCPHAVKERGSAIQCTVNGSAVMTIAMTTDPCPAGRFDGTRVRWAGVEWLGVPEPLRWLLTWQLKREPRNLDGCGCIKAVKESQIGPWVETWFEGITLLRKRFGEFLTEFQVAMRGV